MATQNLDTHIDGPGLSPSTKTWSNWERTRRRYFNEYGNAYDLPSRVNLTGKWAIVTGANSGIGAECTKHLASWGCNIILACRDPPPHEPHPESVIKAIREKSSESNPESKGSQQPELEYWQIDFTSFKSVKAFAQKWLDTGRTLDYLFNNAGLGSGGLGFKLTEDGFEITHQVNYLSHCLLTLMILPSMKESQSPRIVNTASAFHSAGELDFANFNNEKKTGTKNAYCNSKLQLVIFTKELQARLSNSEDYRHVIVNSLHPGFVSSNIWNTPSVKALPGPILMLLNAVVKAKAITSHQGSIAMLHAAFDPSFNFAEAELSDGIPVKGASFKKGGRYFNRITEESPRPEAEDPLVRARLWKRTVEDLKAEENGWTRGLPDQL